MYFMHRSMTKRRKCDKKVVKDMFDARNAGRATIFMMVIVALFLLPFAGVAAAGMANQGHMKAGGGQYSYTYSGKISAIDHSAKTLTVMAGKDNSKIFKLAKDVTITKCGAKEPLKNLKVGDRVTVSYLENGANNFIAGNVQFMLPAGQHC
jgi:ABC-type enterochelin transport system substrate-binding protein